MAKSTTTIAKPAPELDIFAPNFSRRPDIKTHRQLNSSRREIRLLRIWQHSLGLYASLKHASLDDKPVYEAVSYCWGPPSTLHAINLDNHVVWVSKTLFSFLSALCNHDQELPIWVDQLCINQADSEERSSQVTMMGEIYRSAGGVRAWLGNCDVDIGYTLAYINAVSQHHLQESTAMAQQSIEGLYQMCRRPYWRRMWIVQEVGLAKVLIIHCGNRKVDFGDFHKLVAELGPDAGIQTVHDVQQSLGYHATQPQNHERSLIEQIIAFQSRICEDKRDRIYALRSLSRDGAGIVVDYSKTFYEVVWDVLRNWADCELADRDPKSDSGLVLESIPSMMNALGLSVKEMLTSASNMHDPVFAVWQHAGCSSLGITEVTTGFKRVRDHSVWPGPEHESTVLSKASRYSGFDYDEFTFYEYDLLSEEYQPNARSWGFKNSMTGSQLSYIIQADQGRFKIVGIGFPQYDTLQRNERDMPWDRERFRSDVHLFLLLAGHIQCCRFSVLPLRSSHEDEFDFKSWSSNYDLKVHYSLYAILSLSTTSGDWTPDTSDFLDSTYTRLPKDSLCKYDPDTTYKTPKKWE